MKCARDLGVARLISIRVAPLLVLFLVPSYALAQDDIETLRSQVEQQQALIAEQSDRLKAQQDQLDKQAQELERLSERLDEMEKTAGGTAPAAAAQPEAPVGGAEPPSAQARMRDDVGDLNSQAVRLGDFPGSFRIPGTGRVSLAIGGFVKTAAIFDSDAETMGADFLPATLGTRGPDREGAFSLDSTLTRVLIDARAPARSGELRGYVEYDLNASNDGSLGVKMRQAYGTWTRDVGTLTAGHTWSTMMDLKIVPEGLTEPTVSGVIFSRQPVVRWSQALSPRTAFHAAIEDPSSSDFSSDEPTVGHTSVPDGVVGLDYGQAGVGHVRLNGILRDIEVDLPVGGNDSELGWGVSLSGHLNVGERDRLLLSGVYGEGLGRYLLGIQPAAGAAIDPVQNALLLRDNWGAMAAYEHHWTDALRSTAMYGHAHATPLDWQAGDTFESSTYASVNLMWSMLPYLTVGAEYAYGKRENKDGSGLDNQRFALGVQIY